MRLRGIVFDKDGTLFDFNASWAAWVRAMLADEAPDAETAEALAALLGFDTASGSFAPDSVLIAHTLPEVVEVMLPLLPGQSRSALVARLDARAHDVPMVPAAPLPALLGRLRAAGYVLGVATNESEGPARAHLEGAGIGGAFDFVAGADSGHGAKPGPGQLLAFAEATGLPPAEIVMVGDSAHDLLAARAAGMTGLGVLTGLARTPDLAPLAAAVLPSIAGLPDWLDGR